jgi:hypothetical protein
LELLSWLKTQAIDDSAGITNNSALDILMSNSWYAPGAKRKKQIKEKFNEGQTEKVATIIKFDKWQAPRCHYSESKSGRLSFVRCND